MADDLQIFLDQARVIAGHQMTGLNTGRKLVTAQQAGIFYGPDTKPAIANARVWKLPTVAEWAQQAIQALQNLKQVSADIPAAKPKDKSKKPFSIQFST